MFQTGNVQRITKYLLLCVLTLSSDCLASVQRERNGDSLEEFSLKSSSRSLLYSWDDDDSWPKYRDKSSSNNSEAVIYIAISSIILIIGLICRCCIRYGSLEGDGGYSDIVVHPPPRNYTSTLIMPPNVGPQSSSSGYNVPASLSSTDREVRAPPRSSMSIILPHETGTFTVNMTGIDNRNYNPGNPTEPIQQNQQYSLTNQNRTPLLNMLDMPPAYDEVVKEGVKYPTTSSKN